MATNMERISSPPHPKRSSRKSPKKSIRKSSQGSIAAKPRIAIPQFRIHEPYCSLHYYTKAKNRVKMRAGIFYLLDKDLFSEILTFRYLRKTQCDVQYQIYLTIQAHSLEWYYLLEDGSDHASLFKLSFAHTYHGQGTLTDQLQEIKKAAHFRLPKSRFSFSHLGSLQGEIHMLDNDYFEGIHHYQKQFFSHEKDEMEVGIHFDVLLLDFLFDFHHTNIFQESPYFENIRIAIRENHLLQVISKKSQYLYQKSKYEDKQSQKPAEWSLMTHDFEQATKAWIDTLLKPGVTQFYKDSPWLAPLHNIESEIAQIVSITSPQRIKEKETQVLESTDQTLAPMDASQAESIVEFLIQRLNIWSAWNFSRMYFKLHDHLAILCISCFLIPLLLLIYEPVGWGLIACTIPLAIYLMIKGRAQRLRSSDHLTKQNFFRNGPQDISTHIFLMLIMPRLLISIFIAWLSLGSVITKAPNFTPPYSVGYALVLTALIWFYLFQEVRKVAPDLSPYKQQARPLAIIIIAYLYSSLIGGIVLSIAFINFDGTIPYTEEYLDFEVAMHAWLTTTVWAVFFGLFINSLFSGKRFTGF
ncbi:MAG: hypothetical protein AAF135_04945 [Bacteroidota bacterium]